MDWLTQAQAYMPHGMCLAWRPWLMTLHVGSDAAIALAYFAIPISIAAFVRRRTDLEARYRWLALFFVLFITACGLTHVASIVVLWKPLYVAEGILKALTAGVSLATACVLPFVSPALLRVPSPRALSREIAAHRATLIELEEARVRLAAQVATTEGDLEDSNRRFRAAIADSPVTVLEQDADLAYTWVYNPPLGLDPQAVIGLTEADLFEPGAAAVLQALKRDALQADAPRRAEIPIRVGERSGWFDVRVEPVRLRDGAVGLVATSVDITPLKTQQEHLRVVMREMNHRSKNVLAIVIGIARQTARPFDVPEAFVNRLSERLGALASAHDVLANQDWRGADLYAVVHGQLRHQIDAFAGRIHLSGCVCDLPAETAHYVGLALHELGSNALKYGALAHEAGEVSISWSSRPGAVPAENELHLEWRESGVAAVAPPAKSGFGSTILNTLAARALRGACELRFEPGGVVWTLRAPLPERPQAGVSADGEDRVGRTDEGGGRVR